MLLLAFAILAFIKSKDMKNTFTFSNLILNPKTTLFYSISLFSSFSLLPVIYFLLFILFCYRNLVLDNHIVELGTQGKDLILQVV
jgi:hypothetical protein